MFGVTTLFRGRLDFRIILPEWKKWQETWKFEKWSPLLWHLRASWSPQRQLTERSRWAIWDSNPDRTQTSGPDRRRKESGSCLMKQLASLSKSGWLIWRPTMADREDPLEKEMAAHYSILAWRIPWTEEPGGLQSIGFQRVIFDWSDLACPQAAI